MDNNCEICKKENIEVYTCKICDVLYCNDCSALYNQFTQIDYNCCIDCSKTIKYGE